jgi:hypothetical protein
LPGSTPQRPRAAVARPFGVLRLAKRPTSSI